MPSHTGPFEEIIGGAGIEFTVTDVVPAAPAHPFTVAVTEYVPELVKPAFVIVGFCKAEVKPLGPVHAYDALVMADAKSEIEFPVHSGLLLDTIGADGRAFTTATVDDGALVQPFAVTVTLYVPLLLTPTLFITGFWTDETKPFGPVQLYVTPPIADAVKFKFVPWHNGELLDTAGATGMGLTMTGVPVELLVHCPTVTVTEYKPALAMVTLLITGFCCDDVKPLGPVQE